MDITINDITYPANTEEWYCKGNADILGSNNVFEVPAIFNEDGTCNVAETQQKVATFLAYIGQSKLSTLN